MDSFARLREMVHEMTGVPEEQITPESTAAQLHLDSLDMTELVLSVEEEFDVTIADEDLPNLKTVGDLYNYMNDHIA